MAKIGRFEISGRAAFRSASKGVAALAGVSTLYLGIAENRLDLLGDMHSLRTEEETVAIARQRIDRKYATSSVTGRFALLYLQGNEKELSRDSVKVGMGEGGNGLVGKIMGIFAGENSYYYGQNCLSGSSYDIRPSEIRGRASGDINAVATLNIENGVVVIYPAASDGAPIRFNQGVNGELAPADPGTESTLTAYGCAPTVGTDVSQV